MDNTPGQQLQRVVISLIKTICYNKKGGDFYETTKYYAR